MRRRSLRIALGLVAVFVVMLAAGVLYLRMPPPTLPDVRYAATEGREVAYRVLGSGQPVLVMIAGLGDGMATFQDVARELSRHATVIVYDRAGYGASASANPPRDAIAISRELEAVLRQSGVQAPYVLLGHSSGGLYAEYFAATHPADIAGLILEESRSIDFAQRCLATPDIGMCGPPVALLWLSQAGALPEFEALGRTYDEVRHSAPLRGRPVLIVSKFRSAQNQSGFDALWSKEQDALVRRYPGAMHLIAPTGGHQVHVDARDWFVLSIREFLARIR